MNAPGAVIEFVQQVVIFNARLGGKQRDAIAAVPDELVDAVSLVGPKERIRERLEAWRASPVTTLMVGSPQPEALQVLAELVL